MILLDRLLDCRKEGATCEVTIRSGVAFVEEGRVSSVVFLEYMAQTIAAYAGCSARARGDAIRIGYLMSAREMNLHVPHATVGDRLEVTAERVWGDEVTGNFRCAVHRDGALLADATLNVYQGDLA